MTIRSGAPARGASGSRPSSGSSAAAASPRWIAASTSGRPEVANSADAYVLDATFQIDLGPTLEEALTRGVTLHFVTEFELLYERWYFLNLWNKTVLDGRAALSPPTR